MAHRETLDHKSRTRPAKLKVEYIPIGSLRPDPHNPREHSDRQVKQISRSIESFGFNVPVLIDGSSRIVAGHGRVLAARLLEIKELPVIQLESLSDAQARAFAIADNRLAENSAWNDKLLNEVLGELAALELDFSLEDTGFSIGEIDLRIGDAAPSTFPDPADEFPPYSDQPAISKPGDLWMLGRHRVLCGNALEEASFRTLMERKRAQLIFTDMPFNVPIRGHVNGKGRIKHREFAMASGEMSDDQFVQFMATAMRMLAAHSMNGSLHFHCMDWRHAMDLLTAGRQAYTELKNLCVWTKPNPGMGSFYRSQHELVFVFKNGRANHRNNIELGAHGRNRSNVWQYPSPASFGAAGEEGKLLILHPTVKPVAMVADAILDASARGDIVLDSFLGSGSTLIAAERVGRSCFGIELDPLYVDTIIRRWQRHTGDRAIHTASKRPFDSMHGSGKTSRGKAA